MKKVFIAIIVLGVFYGCGKKFPLPEESNEGMPSETEYVEIQNTNWDNLIFGKLSDVIIGEDGYIYVIAGGDEDTVFRFSVAGENRSVFATGAGFVSISQDKNENMYVAEKDGIVLKYRWDGVLTDSFDLHDICVDSVFRDSFLTSIYVLSENDFIVSFAPLNLVLRYQDSIFDTVATYGTGIEYTRSPHGVYGSANMQVALFASSGNNWVEGISLTLPHYNMVHLGGDSYDGGVADTVFLNPEDVCMDDSSYIYVLDSGNKAMKKFKFNGAFVTVLKLNESPVSVAVSHDGKTLYIAMGNRIRKYKLPEIPGQGGEQ